MGQVDNEYLIFIQLGRKWLNGQLIPNSFIAQSKNYSTCPIAATQSQLINPTNSILFPATFLNPSLPLMPKPMLTSIPIQIPDPAPVFFYNLIRLLLTSFLVISCLTAINSTLNGTNPILRPTFPFLFFFSGLKFKVFVTYEIVFDTSYNSIPGKDSVNNVRGSFVVDDVISIRGTKSYCP